MKKYLVFSVMVLVLGLLAMEPIRGDALAGGFPKGWEKWEKVNSPLVEIGALPDCSADVHTLPAIYQETVATYCSVRPGGPGKVEVLVNPSSIAAYKARSGKFADGNNMILHLIDMKVLFVTSHKRGAPSYDVYTEDGKNITAKEGPLGASVCQECHSGYSAFCMAGQCGKLKK